MPKITSFLTFPKHAEEAARFYVSLFEDSEIGQITRYGRGAPGPEGTVMTVAFRLRGTDFVALNGGPHFEPTDAFSLSVECDSQEEVDHFWDALSAGGEQGPCGWLKDRFGLSWQVNATVLGPMLGDPEADRAKRVMDAMLGMTKIVIEDLEAAYRGE